MSKICTNSCNIQILNSTKEELKPAREMLKRIQHRSLIPISKHLYPRNTLNISNLRNIDTPNTKLFLCQNTSQTLFSLQEKVPSGWRGCWGWITSWPSRCLRKVFEGVSYIFILEKHQHLFTKRRWIGLKLCVDQTGRRIALKPSFDL